MEAGANVALGSDATAPDRSSDMFRHIQQAMHYHRRHFRDASVLPPGQALAMATIRGARALGMADRIGSLEVGKEADLILVNMNRPHLHPLNMLPTRVACFANGNDVDTVIIGGQILFEGGKALHLDEAAILARAQAEAEAMIERIGARADLVPAPGFWGSAAYLEG